MKYDQIETVFDLMLEIFDKETITDIINTQHKYGSNTLLHDANLIIHTSKCKCLHLVKVNECKNYYTHMSKEDSLISIKMSKIFAICDGFI